MNSSYIKMKKMVTIKTKNNNMEVKLRFPKSIRFQKTFEDRIEDRFKQNMGIQD